MCFFFFKQKTAYEMRISDWSSDVCSSDLALGAGPRSEGSGGGRHGGGAGGAGPLRSTDSFFSPYRPSDRTLREQNLYGPVGDIASRDRSLAAPTARHACTASGSLPTTPAGIRDDGRVRKESCTQSRTRVFQ